MTRYVIGFLRRDVSGGSREQDEARIHALATELGYSVAVMVLADPDRDAVLSRLMNLLWGEYVDTLIAPGLEHFEAGEIPALVKFADVVCANTRERFTVNEPLTSV
ncbi:hypothetical protein AB0N05_00510 [Nocardia sp. NPDC051030]|uniref:hypothetical protein n=1 Tax=Nocardia sp. NPDC051030 TaxID=3155162 RepID=UPI00343AF091